MRSLFALAVLLAGCQSREPHMPTPNARELIGDRDSGKAAPPADAGQTTGLLIYEVVASILRVPSKAGLLTGYCRVKGDAASNIFTPCHSVEIVLQNAEGKALDRARTDQGDFRFKVQKDRQYRLQLNSPHYELPDKDVGPFSAGDTVAIELHLARRP